jgi:hypothetical protein
MLPPQRLLLEVLHHNLLAIVEMVVPVARAVQVEVEEAEGMVEMVERGEMEATEATEAMEETVVTAVPAGPWSQNIKRATTERRLCELTHLVNRTTTFTKPSMDLTANWLPFTSLTSPLPLSMDRPPPSPSPRTILLRSHPVLLLRTTTRTARMGP